MPNSFANFLGDMEWTIVLVAIVFTFFGLAALWRNIQLFHIIHKLRWENKPVRIGKRNTRTEGVYLWQKLTLFGYRTVYVGQSTDIEKRVRQHLNGKGNPELYHDWCQNKKLRLKIVPLTETKFKTLDHLEKRLIHHYRTDFKHGYNHTEGNGDKTY